LIQIAKDAHKPVKKGWYKYVLREKALIDVSILDPLDKIVKIDSNKIMAFGGDFGEVVEGTYGHFVIARKNVTEVLTKLVEDGYYSEEDAILIAKRILRENALELYQLKKVGDYFERSE